VAHELDFSTGRAGMAYAGETPWHGPGQKLEPDASFEEWRVAAGMKWRANRARIMFDVGPEGESDLRDWAKHDVLYRSDTKAPLGIVSHRYRIVQPKTVLRFFQTLCEDVGGFSMETAGCLFGGRKIWGLARAEKSFCVGDDDRVRRYLLFATSYDLSCATTIRQTSIRVVCNNTLQAAMAGGSDFVVQRHASQFRPSLIREKMHLDESWTAFRAACRKLAGIKIKRQQAVEIFTALFLGPDGLAQKRKIEAATRLLTTAPGQQLDTAKGTAWGVLNAITRLIDHEAKTRTADNRLDKAWFGSGAMLKKRALEILLAV
jgi:phage/plasmid-like protein (TIGR03299 family)